MTGTQGRDSWRVFCAVELPEGVRARVAERSARLRAAFREARVSWERPEKLHLTIKFLGEVGRARVAELSAAAGRAAAGVEEFSLSLGGAGAFPPRGAARVLWLGVADPDGRLAELQRRLEDECAAAGFPREPRSFSPHLTVARIRDPRPRGASELHAAHLLEGFAAQTFDVTGLSVVRSELGPAGARYTTISRHTLARA
jgi:RNA 2',3'-cyclic 3'-phosphodiesterase